MPGPCWRGCTVPTGGAVVPAPLGSGLAVWALSDAAGLQARKPLQPFFFNVALSVRSHYIVPIPHLVVVRSAALATLSRLELAVH